VRRGQVTWLVTHWAGCLLYFIALQEGAGVRTWLDIKPEFVASLGSFERRAQAGPMQRATPVCLACRNQHIDICQGLTMLLCSVQSPAPTIREPLVQSGPCGRASSGLHG